MIAVFDSGVGGTSVLRELIRIMPSEDFYYYGDTRYAPYGTKGAEEIRDRVDFLVESFLSLGAKAIVIACNTATAVAADDLRNKYPQIPIIGIEPALKPASLVCNHPRVLCLATPLTFQMPRYEALEKRFSDVAKIDNLPCPGMMELIEQGHLDDDIMDAYLKQLMTDRAVEAYDACVLGCTHYPHAKKAIQRILGEQCQIIDGGEGTARETKRRLEAVGLLSCENRSGNVIFENSMQSSVTNELAKKLTFL